ncbi:MAG: hypothetical protein D6826_06925 [Alphaproteobacteria bacterium]|nr:MAG: hypothetical protein D6826_06925 [Alphaproteobacteria bacterium]
MTNQVRIYRQAKPATQSGRAHTDDWILEFEPAPLTVEPLMGWTATTDTQSQIRMRFPTREEAVAYARKHALMYTLETPKERRIRPKAYADNFRHDRLLRWTH